MPSVDDKCHQTSSHPSSDQSQDMPPPQISRKGMIHVLDCQPTEGDPGVPISVRINFSHDCDQYVFLRLVVGSIAVPTIVREISGMSYGGWMLDAIAPSIGNLETSQTVDMTVQALDEKNEVLDSISFGRFSYWVPSSDSQKPPKLEDEEYLPPPSNRPSTRARAMTTNQIPSKRPTSSVSDHQVPVPRARPHSLVQRRIRANSLMRTKYPAAKDSSDDELRREVPQLDIISSLESMCMGWSSSEVRASRRLVRFRKVIDGRKLIVSCEAIDQEEYQETDSVISCIYREEVDSFYVTSVDIIYLLERLVEDEFPVEEKNRIRRNLEGLRPTTVSKQKHGFENFFQLIMEFPDPKPRNIEKDLKVFEWSLLRQALDKILAKYSIYTSNSSPSDSTVSLPKDIPDEMPSLSYDPVHVDNLGLEKYSGPQSVDGTQEFLSISPFFMHTESQHTSGYPTPGNITPMNSFNFDFPDISYNHAPAIHSYDNHLSLYEEGNSPSNFEFM